MFLLGYDIARPLKRVWSMLKQVNVYRQRFSRKQKRRLSQLIPDGQNKILRVGGKT